MELAITSWCKRSIDVISSRLKKIKWLKNIVRSQFGAHLIQGVEGIVWGGRKRRALTQALLTAQYKSKFRSNWIWALEVPHFSDNERFESICNNPNNAAYTFYRGILTTEVLKAGDSLLDIGCGDGFFVYRFYSHKCKEIDAVDIDMSAIEYAKKYNSATNVNYLLLDAVNSPFPRKHYDVISWDGAIGHFSAGANDILLSKISNALNGSGMFVGSESLGSEEGHDHLQFFETVHDLGSLLKKFFTHVSMRETIYPVSRHLVRREAYWRCSNASDFKDRFGWIDI
jgi:SAM-dependent methyltransferase